MGRACRPCAGNIHPSRRALEFAGFGRTAAGEVCPRASVLPGDAIASEPKASKATRNRRAIPQSVLFSEARVKRRLAGVWLMDVVEPRPPVRATPRPRQEVRTWPRVSE